MRIRGWNEKKKQWVVMEIFTDSGGIAGMENWYDIAVGSIGVSTESTDMQGTEVFQGDIVLYGSSGVEMEIKYGNHQVFCREDKCLMNSFGFFAETKNLKHMPIGALDEYAIVIANSFGK